MKFIDEAIIEVTAGNGGNGCVSFRREKYVPKGGPDGGNGGRGGHVIFQTDPGLSTLMDVRYRRHIRAARGTHGKGNQMHGRSGEDCVVRIPVGTVVRDAQTNDVLRDLDCHPFEWIAAHGGKGGWGNMHFVSATNRAPRRADKGELGEHRRIRLELKLLADVGLIGFPNAGKSTLIASVSNARPKIADYPFTTKFPHLGLVTLPNGNSCVFADIPGLIEGASDGAGMGIQFLRHIERTRLFLHLLDISDPAHSDPVKKYRIIRKELKKYDRTLIERPEIICLTKIDVTDVRERCEEVTTTLHKETDHPVLTLSAVTGEGKEAFLLTVAEFLQKHTHVEERR